MFVLEDHKKVSLTCLSFSHDGQTLVAGGYHGVVRLWSPQTRQLTGSLSTGNWNNSAVLFMPQDEGLVVLVGGLLRRYSRRGEVMGFLPPQGYRRFYFSVAAASPDGRRVCLGHGYQKWGLMQVELPGFETVWKLPARWSGQASALAYSADGRFIACGLNTGEVTVRDAVTGEVRHRPDGAASEVKAIALSPDGRHVAWCAGTQLHLWRLDPPGQILRHSLGRTFFLSVAFHTSGDFFATANGDGKVDYWDARTGEHRQAFDWQVGKLHDVVFDATGDRAACCSKSGKIVVWDVDR